MNPGTRFLLQASSLVALGPTIWFMSVSPPPYFMDQALAVITLFVGLTCTAAVVIRLVRLIFGFVIEFFTSYE